MEEKELFEKNKLIQQVLKMPHGNLYNYIESYSIAKQDKDLFAHFTVWNNEKSVVRDSKIAFPVLALRTFNKSDTKYAENAIANLMTLNPRDLYKAYLFSKELTLQNNRISGGWRKLLQNSIQKYLEIRENNNGWWDNTVVRNRKAMLGLYAISHKKPTDRVQKILFEKQYPNDSVFEAIKNLKNLPELEAGSLILKHKIPMPLVATSGLKIKDNQNLLLAMVENMTGNEILNNSNMLKQLGAFNFPAVKASYDNAINKAKDDKRVNVFKASKAVEKVDKNIGNKLISIQKSKEKELKKIQANVLILADASGSMQHIIELSKKIAGAVSANVVGNNYLIFFNSSPRLFKVTDKSYDEICSITKNVVAQGQTSVGCGLSYINDCGYDIDIIIIVSDGGENSYPSFVTAYKKYVSKKEQEPVVYFFRVGVDRDTLSESCASSNIQIEKFEVGSSFDYYALPNILNTIETKRYALINEILDTPLLTLDTVFNKKGD